MKCADGRAEYGGDVVYSLRMDQKQESIQTSRHGVKRNRKPIRRGLRRPFEWLGIFLGMLVFTNLTHRMLFALCDFLAATMFLFDRRGRALALANLRIVLGSASGAGYAGKVYGAPHVAPPTRREKLILKRSYRNMARTIGHVFWTSRNAMKRASSVAVFSPKCLEVLAEHKPLVTVSAHLGCWEVLSQLVHLQGRRMISVAKDIGTPAMTELLMKSRKSIGQEIVHADGAFRPLYEGLKGGADVGLLVDQVVKPKDGGVWVEFFGRPVPVSVAPAFLAAKTHATIVVAWSRPLKDGTYRCEYINLYPWRKGTDVWGRTQDCIRDLERVIRRHPSCWVLNYRYFRKTPNEAELKQLVERKAKAERITD